MPTAWDGGVLNGASCVGLDGGSASRGHGTRHLDLGKARRFRLVRRDAPYMVVTGVGMAPGLTLRGGFWRVGGERQGGDRDVVRG